MKKIIAILLVLCMIFCFVSCGEQADTTTTANSTENPIEQEQPASKVYYRRGHLFAEAETRVLYFHDLWTLYQYNKITEESDVFCFDPLCKHGKNCISARFSYLNPLAVASGSMSMEYCAADNRYYFTRGEQIYSVSFDGSDVKIACSFGEVGKFENDENDNNLNGNNKVSHMQIYGQYVYFFTVDAEKGTRVLKRYDVKTKETSEVLHQSKGVITFYGFHEEYLYIGVIGEEYGVYRMSLDGTDMTKLHDNLISDTSAWGIFDDECIYNVTRPQEGIYGIEAYHIENGNKETLLSSEQHLTLLAVTEDSIYYTKKEPRLLGYNVSPIGTREVFNDNSRIYCLDKKTFENKIVFDDITCGVNDIHFSGNTVMINGYFCTVSETDAKKAPAAFTAKINEDGMFTEITEPE